MIFSAFIVVLLIWVIQKLWKMRNVLILSIKLRNKYLALPIVGHGYMFLGTNEDRMKAFQKLGREAIKSKYGLTSHWWGPQYYVMICDPIIAGVVSKASLGKTSLAELSRHLLGNGSIFAPVHIWRPRRKVLVPAFSPRNLHSYVKIFAEQSMVMMDCLKSRAGSGTFSIWNNITSYTMDSVCQTALGVNMNVQTEYHPFLEAFDKYTKLMSKRFVQPWLHWDLLYKLLPVYKEVERNRKIIHDFVNGAIKNKKILLENSSVTDSNPNSQNTVQVTSSLEMLLTSPGGSKYTDLEVREEILVLFLAATDTSAVGASFTVVMLSRYLSVQEKAYQEIRQIFGDSTRPVTANDLPKLKYIEAIIKETLRLYPPVPIILRENIHDVKLNSDITLPAGSCAVFNIWGIHRNPQYWGTDAEEFNPDRFMNGNVTTELAYMPFSLGPRNCLGYMYAMISMKVAVTTLLREYKVLPPSEISAEDLRKPLRLEYDIMMKDVEDFKVRLDHRS